MKLRARLLAGLAVLVFVAIASTGWLTLSLARRRLAADEEDRVRAVGQVAVSLVERAWREDVAAGAGDTAPHVAEVARSLSGAGALGELIAFDARLQPLPGDPADAASRIEAAPPVPAAPARSDGDADVALAYRGDLTLVRRSRGALSFYAPLHAGDRHGVLRIRLRVGETLAEALSGSLYLLGALTCINGGLILLFGALFIRGVVRPLVALAGAAGRVAAGDLDVPPVATDDSDGELAELSRAFARMTAALREQRARLAASREQIVAQEKLATVGRLAAGVAHEIGNPLTSVLGYVELLLHDAPAGSPSRDLLQRIQAETSRIHGTVHDLLDFARPVAERVEPVRLDDVCAAAVDLVAPQPRMRGVSVERRLDPALPPVAASSRHLLQVVLNLLLNAADAIGGTGGLVRLVGRVGEGGATVELDVADSGPGVAEADRERIFDPFFTTKPPGAGTGLGLAVCRSIVAAFGGDIRLVPPDGAASPTASGALFRVTLPRYQPPA